jgi:hypothetical protein
MKSRKKTAPGHSISWNDSSILRHTVILSSPGDYDDALEYSLELDFPSMPSPFLGIGMGFFIRRT